MRNWGLMNRIDYDSFNSVKEAVILYNWLYDQAKQGDSIAASIYVDIKTAIYKPKLLTAKQMEVVDLIVNHQMTQETIAEYLMVSQQRVSSVFDNAVTKIKKILNSGRLF